MSCVINSAPRGRSQNFKRRLLQLWSYVLWRVQSSCGLPSDRRGDHFSGKLTENGFWKHVQQVLRGAAVERAFSGAGALGSRVHAVRSPDLSSQSPARLRGWPDVGQGSVRMLRPVCPAGVGALRRTGLGARLLRPGADLRLFQHNRRSRNP